MAEYAFPSVLQFLQSEWRRFERDRNEWDIEKAEMKARIAFLEGEKRGVDNTKVDLMKRVKMLEYALRQERSKYVEANNANGPTKGSTTPPPDATRCALKAKQKKLTPIISLARCLQEISYLTASVPQSVAMAMPLAAVQNRLSRHEFEKRAGIVGPNGMRGGGSKNRHSDFFPASSTAGQMNGAVRGGEGGGTGAPPPPLSRSNSVPIATFQTLSNLKPATGSPSLDPATTTNMTGPLENNGDQTTLKQQPSKLTNGMGAVKNNLKSVATVKKEQGDDRTAPDTLEDEKQPTGLEAFQREEAITVMHAPLSGEQWHTELQKAGRQLAENANAKKTTGEKAEDVAQLSKDVRDKFNITSEQLNKMVKGWDVAPVKNSIRKKKSKDEATSDELAALSISERDALDNGSATWTEGDSNLNEPIRWRPKVTLRRHLDTVRSIAFHPSDKALLSGSEDGTMKYWNLDAPLKETKRPLNGEVEPIHTYRGHTKPITAVAISENQNKCFSASMDSTVRSWKLVPMDKETYAQLDPTLPASSFIGHTDTVWDIKLFPLSISSSSSQLLASISADGALKIWDTQTKGSPLRSSWGYNGLEASELVEPTEAYTSGLTKLPTPTAMDFCPTDLRKMVVSYSNAVIKLFDIETGKEILAFKSNESYDGTTATQINKIVCHPTLPMVVSGHEDRYIRFFDINSGACSFSMLSHLDAVSSLDIDPTGLVLCSGGHDGSVRLWDIASSTRSCVQEFNGHRRKSDEGVTSVKYHPTMPGLLATGGADSIVKVYTRS
ncbi:hypothetical protein EDD11_003451 [Mortierella claussenii]|nr:hypothetical protein EDD11_003451 [Mortierella claussenii]